MIATKATISIRCNIKRFSFLAALLLIVLACTKEAPQTSNVFFVPNTFTPVGSAFVNNEFKPVLNPINTVTEDTLIENNISEYAFVIRNRNDEKVFESFNVEMGWNGEFNGENAPMGVYVWEIRFILNGSAEKQLLLGYVNLLR